MQIKIVEGMSDFDKEATSLIKVNNDLEASDVDSNIFFKRKSKSFSSKNQLNFFVNNFQGKILEDVKIDTESFRCLKSTQFNQTYRIVKCIGQGGYGKVYKVEHKTFKYTRAMKSINSTN
jgi:hypothetical protein